MALVVKTPPVKSGDIRSLGWEDPLEETRQPTPVFLPGESRSQRGLVGYSPSGPRQSDTTKAS